MLYRLIYFITCWLCGCQPTDDTGITIQWTDKKPTSIAIPYRLIESIPEDSLEQLLTVRLAGQPTAILGRYGRTGNTITFEPVVPFTRGLHYIVWLRANRVGDITIPTLAADDKPAVLAIYPSGDTLPSNLLKFYVHFSRPMREGQSAQYVALLTDKADTLPDVFLNLQPELWNANRTMLTLWLDPGRIKRDLQPNKQLGAPLQTSNRYRLVISAAWPDEQGASLGKTTTKTFIASQRDSLSPNPATWSIQVPKAGNNSALTLSFGESLDYSLLAETIQVFREDGKRILGKWLIGKEEKNGQFIPVNPWQTGQYKLRVESRLEDLAGNNLNRPFDRDITKNEPQLKKYSFVERSFTTR